MCPAFQTVSCAMLSAVLRITVAAMPLASNNSQDTILRGYGIGRRLIIWNVARVAPKEGYTSNVQVSASEDSQTHRHTRHTRHTDS
eukprot:2636374-Rhodomonas_salina.2